MGKRKFTEEQLSAIQTRDKTLLVSAAAGSGKTATLTERIIRSITDSEHPEDISRMLIVTFTNAAVQELRERITAALKEKLAESKNDKRLEHQLYMLSGAKISTIDSFCNDILKNNAERFGISPNYRIADPIEANILAHSVWSALIDAAYNGEIPDVTSPESFEELASCLTGVKSDSALEKIFEMLYEKANSREEGVEIYRIFKEELGRAIGKPPEKNKYGAYAISSAKAVASHYIAVYNKLKLLLDAESEDDLKYLNTVEEDTAALEAILRTNSYTKMQTALSYEFKPLPRVKVKSDIHVTVAAAREKMKEALIKKCANRYFTYSEEEWTSHLKELYGLLSTLSAFIEKFDKIYFEEKRRRSMLEYSDIERLTYLSLYDREGNFTELALSLKEQFSSVYIDEYQDVNALQNKIFAAVSKPTNRFMVGDIKQSIYGFRSARPDIFAKMKNEFAPLAKANGTNAASIFMSKNFRCDRGIVNFVNDVFDLMFTLSADSIGYVTEDRLEYAKLDGAENYTVPEIQLFTKDDVSDGEEEKTSELPPAWVAQKIKELLSSENLNSGSPIRPSDIAIILRKDSGRSALYAEALESVGIKTKVPDNKNFFLNAEVQLILCLLNAINNPARDIYLAGLMLSPLFNFSADELYLVKKFGGGDTLWESLKNYSQTNESFIKGKSFIDTLNRYRAISEGMKVDALIMRLYNETGALALAAKDNCKENLLLLYNYARKFEASSFEGLYNFINYVNTVIDSGAKFSSKKEGEDEDAVSIITVHKSKGLEYPIVFLADAATPLVSATERRARVAYSDELGVAMRTRVPGGLALVESPVYNAVMDYNTDNSVEEELRVYYVALTRARERLFIVGAPKVKSREEYLEGAALRKLAFTPYTIKELKSFVDILYSVDTEAKIQWGDNSTSEDYDLPVSQKENFVSDVNNESDTELYSVLSTRFSFKYPHSHLSLLPEKMSISKLYPTVLDGDDDGIRMTIENFEENEERRSGKLPSFITGNLEGESALKGIATHNFLQFFDIERLKSLGVSAEIERLVKDGFISHENAARVRLGEIELFLKSDLFENMRNAVKLYREFRFSVMLPAALFTQDSEKKAAFESQKILLQGVIDCIIEDTDGNLHLIDYKTDRLTKEELADSALAAKALCEKHYLQLFYYALAVEKIFSKKPTTVRIYSLPLGNTVDVGNIKI